MRIRHKLIKIMLAMVISSVMVMTVYGYGGDSSGDSGGAMATSNVDPYSNIVKYEVRDGNLIANLSIEYSFTTPEFGIYQILINGKENEFDIPIRIEDLRNTSIYAEPVPGIVYRNENVWLGSTRVNYIGIRFRVKNSWITDNGIDDGRLPYLLKWNGTTWSVLKTNMTGKDDIYTYLESPKAGNSRIGIFAISAPTIRANGIMANDSINITTENMVIPEHTVSDLNGTGKKAPSGGIGFKGYLGFGIVMTIIGIIIMLIYIGEKKY